MTTAFVFPGMGPTGYVDLAKFALVDRTARAVFAEADEALGHRLLTAFKDSTDDYSVAAQVAFFAASVALGRIAEQRAADPVAYCAGPSFGEKPMIAFVDALPFADAVRLTARLGEITDAYFAEQHQDLVTVSLARARPDELAPVLDDLRERDVWFDTSCVVDDDFVMITLGEDVLAEFESAARGIGAMPLYVMRPPMHSSVFGALRERAAAVLDDVPFAAPRIPVVHDGTGAVLTTGAELRAMLLDAFVAPVRWPLALDTLHERGVDDLVFAGPDALFSRVRRTTTSFRVVGLDPRRALRPAA